MVPHCRAIFEYFPRSRATRTGLTFMGLCLKVLEEIKEDYEYIDDLDVAIHILM